MTHEIMVTYGEYLERRRGGKAEERALEYSRATIEEGGYTSIFTSEELRVFSFNDYLAGYNAALEDREGASLAETQLEIAVKCLEEISENMNLTGFDCLILSREALAKIRGAHENG